MLKNIIEYQKSVFDAGYKTMEILQGGTEKIINDYWNGDNLIKEVMPLNTIISEHKKQCNNYKELIDEGFDKLSDFFTFMQ